MTTIPIDILHVVPAYWPRAGGVETLVAGMVEGLRARHGLTSAVITPRRVSDPQEEILHEGVRVIPAPIPILTLADDNFRLIHRLFSTMRKTYEEVRPKIVHIHAYSEIALAACIVARSSGIPCIFHVHGMLWDKLSTSFFKELKTSPYVYAVSKAVADSIAPFTGRTAPVITIPNGIRNMTMKPMPKSAANDMVPTVLMVGRLEDEKGFEDGLRAIHKVKQAGKAVKAVIVGRGEVGVDLHQVAAELGISDNVEFKGEMPYAEAQKVIACADILLVPSREVEGFSLVCLEAALAEVPVIGSAVGGIPETIGDCGQLVEPRDINGFAEAILHYLNNPVLMREHGLQGRVRALNVFNYDTFINRWAAEYGKILSQADTHTV